MSYGCLKLGGLRFLGVRLTGYYDCEALVTTGTKFITTLIVDNELITYENMFGADHQCVINL